MPGFVYAGESWTGMGKWTFAFCSCIDYACLCICWGIQDWNGQVELSVLPTSHKVAVEAAKAAASVVW